MIVTVTDVEPQPGSTVWTATGTEAVTGDTVIFGGDWRAMEGLAALVEDMGEVQAEVEEWQVLTREVTVPPHPFKCTCPECHPPL